MEFDELMDATPDHVTPVDGTQVEEKELSDTVLHVDLFNRRHAERIDEDEEHHSHAEWSDGFAACFEPRPQLLPADETADQQRQQWFTQLMDTPEFKSLHAQTACNEEMAEIGASQLLKHWKQFAAEHPEPEGHSYDAEDIHQIIERIKTTGKAVADALNDVKDARDAAHAFGAGAGADAGMSGKDVMAAFRRLKNDPQLRHISEVAGRYRRLASSLQRSKPVHGMDDNVGVTLDDDLSRLVSSEAASLCVPETEMDTLRRLMEKETLCREYKAMEGEGRGPIMVLIDESGSMGGDPIAHAKGLALALAWLARHQKRWISLVGWSNSNQVRSIALPPDRFDQTKLMDWCSAFYCGGTTPPVSQMQRLFDETNAPKGKTDVIWITDGETCISDEEIASFKQFAAANQARVWTIAIGTSGDTFRPISDVVASIPVLGTDAEVVRDVLSI